MDGSHAIGSTESFKALKKHSFTDVSKTFRLLITIEEGIRSHRILMRTRHTDAICSAVHDVTAFMSAHKSVTAPRSCPVAVTHY